MFRGLVLVGLAATTSMLACSSEAGSSGTDSQDVTSDAQAITSAVNTADFNHIWRLEGSVTYFEGQTTLVLVNASQPKKPLIRQTISSGIGTYVAPFSATITFGDPLENDGADLPKAGDCFAVKNDPGAEVLSEADLRARPEFGAFVYVSDPLSGAPRLPGWGLTMDDKIKVYKSVSQCLNDPDRKRMERGAGEKLTSVTANSGKLRLQGAIGDFEGMAHFVIVNTSHVEYPILAEGHDQTGGGMDQLGKLDVEVPSIASGPLDERPQSGDCLAVTNVSGGRGYSNNETRAKAPIGVFKFEYEYGSAGAQLFDTVEACKTAR